MPSVGFVLPTSPPSIGQLPTSEFLQKLAEQPRMKRYAHLIINKIQVSHAKNMRNLNK